MGRRLSAPLLQFGQKKFFKFVDDMKGSWEQPKSTEFFRPASIKSYAIIDLTGDKSTDMERVVQKLIDTGKKFGMTFAALPSSGLEVACDPRQFQNNEDTAQAVFENAIEVAKEAFGQNPQYIFVALGPRGRNPYKEVKRLTELSNSRGVNVVTQCCMYKPDLKPSYYTNFILKTNAKNMTEKGLLGVNQQVVGNLKSSILFKEQLPTFYIGIDVTYRSMEDQEVSLAAVVGLMDKIPFQYQTRYLITTGESRQELRPDIQKPVEELLLEYKRINGTLPNSIFVYRDGVGDSMFEQVLATEYTCIKKACTTIESDYNPPVTFIIVQKRHSTRFFPLRQQDQDRNGNVKPGVAVDTGICSPINWDWYLTHHQTIQGTSKSTKYVVLVDENNMSTEKLMLMTHWMTYTYSRAYKAVSVVPPAYYAHLAAEREAVLTPVGQTTPPKVAKNISQKMYFI
eukprot:TRINITY_DN14786_c0_g1_i1.p1 TRINITY_DN14786_c0_g1~~TRINITY_DN14786_c0_g1_i1.p1  ORF type:complete len:455 (-),score=70.80 TRINITY_DN14786_c0_g1_i1:353-1717(-)